MSSTLDRNTQAGADASMARVLAAERAAREAVEACAAEARECLDRARALEKSIAARAAARSADARASLAARRERRLAEIAAADRAIDATSTPRADEHARLAQAIERLADELAGGTP
jgi:cell division septum initiation protein DivIVA